MKQIGLRSYQDIITPEAQEERDRKRYEREIYEQEKAEYLADERREKEMLEKMTKKQKAFYDYLQKLKTEEREGTRFVETALKEFFKYWEKYEKDGVKDSMTVAMEATEAFVGHPVKVHLN